MIFPCVSFLLSVCFFFLCLFIDLLALLCDLWALSFLTRDWTQAQAAKVPNPNHCTIRELPTCVFCSVSLLVTDSLTLHLSPNICLSLLLKDIFIGYRILDWLLLFVLILSASVLFSFNSGNPYLLVIYSWILYSETYSWSQERRHLGMRRAQTGGPGSWWVGHPPGAAVELQQASSREQCTVTCGGDQARAVTSTHRQHRLGRAWLGGPRALAQREAQGRDFWNQDSVAPVATGETASVISDEKTFMSLYPCR